MEDYGQLKACRLIIECTIENPEIRKKVYAQIEQIIAHDALLAGEPSANPISTLQQLTRHPAPFFGLHWMRSAIGRAFRRSSVGSSVNLKGWEYL